MHALDILGDPVRRRILEQLARGELSSGDIVAEVQREFDITQSAVSQHLRVLRESGFASVRVDGQRRVYALAHGPLQEVDSWLAPFRSFWQPRLEALATEVARGKHKRRKSGGPARSAPAASKVARPPAIANSSASARDGLTRRARRQSSRGRA